MSLASTDWSKWRSISRRTFPSEAKRSAPETKAYGTEKETLEGPSAPVRRFSTFILRNRGLRVLPWT